jgi:hypothetical protein
MLYRRGLLWLVPLFLTLHNLEELFGLPALLAELPDSLPAWVTRLFPAGVFPPTYRQYLVMLLGVTLLPYLAALLPGAGRQRGLRTTLLVGTQAVMLVNVFAHLLQALLTRGYVPGLVTAFGFNLPFSLYFFWQGLKTGWIRDVDLGPLALTALLLHGPGLLGLILIAARIAAAMS